MVGQFTRRHGDKIAICPFDNLEIANHKIVIERDAAKGFEPIITVFDELDTRFSDLQVAPPVTDRGLFRY